MYPVISIIIATYNSQRTLEVTLQSIKNQTYPRLEILVIDGGSIDNTRNIAKKYRCKLIENPMIDPVSAKHIGFRKANGKFILFLDSDEVLEKSSSLMDKYLAVKKDPRVRSVVPNGYITPSGEARINFYINEFGDPFSYFFYRQSMGKGFFLKDWKSKYKSIYEDKNTVCFEFSKSLLPLLELSAGGCMTDLEFVRKNFPKVKNDSSLITHLFYLLVQKGAAVAVTKNDSTIHYSSNTLGKYLKKISSRIKNNIFSTDVGWVGFNGREQFQSSTFNLKKYLFIPYSIFLLFPIIDSLYLYYTRKNSIYLLHLSLSLYTSLMIVYLYILKRLGIKPDIRVYG